MCRRTLRAPPLPHPPPVLLPPPAPLPTRRTRKPRRRKRQRCSLPLRRISLLLRLHTHAQHRFVPRPFEPTAKSENSRAPAKLAGRLIFPHATSIDSSACVAA